MSAYRRIAGISNLIIKVQKCVGDVLQCTRTYGGLHAVSVAVYLCV